MTKKTDSPPAPYVSYGVFKTAVETLAKSTVPTGPIDRHVLDRLSGAAYGALISCLKFMGLVDDDRKAKPRFRDLVKAFKQGHGDYRIDCLRMGWIGGQLVWV